MLKDEFKKEVDSPPLSTCEDLLLSPLTDHLIRDKSTCEPKMLRPSFCCC